METLRRLIVSAGRWITFDHDPLNWSDFDKLVTSRAMTGIKESETTLLSMLHSHRGSEYLYAAVFGGGRAKGTLKILQELLNHGGLVAVVRAGITYLTSKCPAGAGSPFWILFHDRTLNDASVALNDTVRACSSTLCSFSEKPFLVFAFFRLVSRKVDSLLGAGPAGKECTGRDPNDRATKRGNVSVFVTVKGNGPNEQFGSSPARRG